MPNLLDHLNEGCQCDLCVRLRQNDSRLRDRLRESETVSAICSGRCSRKGKGVRVNDYFGKAFTARKFSRGVQCDNCKAPMVEVARVSTELA